MTTSGVASLARTRLPSCTISAPVRPAIGAVIVAYCSCTFGVLDRGAVGVERRLERRRRRSRRVDLLLGGDAALGEILVALRLRFRVRRLRRVALQVRLGLLERRFERPAVEREQHLALLTSSPSLKPTEVSSPVICARTATVEKGSTRADHVELERHRLLGDDRGGHGHARAAAGTAAAAGAGGVDCTASLPEQPAAASDAASAAGANQKDSLKDIIRIAMRRWDRARPLSARDRNRRTHR